MRKEGRGGAVTCLDPAASACLARLRLARCPQAQLAPLLEQCLLAARPIRGNDDPLSLGFASLLLNMWDPSTAAVDDALRLVLPGCILATADCRNADEGSSPWFLDVLLDQLTHEPPSSSEADGPQTRVLLLRNLDCARQGLQDQLERVLSCGWFLSARVARHTGGERDLAVLQCALPGGLVVVGTRLPLPLLAHRMRIDAASSAVTGSAEAALALGDSREAALRKTARATRRESAPGDAPVMAVGRGADGGGSRTASRAGQAAPPAGAAGGVSVASASACASGLDRVFAQGPKSLAASMGDLGSHGEAGWRWAGLTAEGLGAGALRASGGPLSGPDTLPVPLWLASPGGLAGVLNAASAAAVERQGRARVSGASRPGPGVAARPGSVASGAAAASTTAAATDPSVPTPRAHAAPSHGFKPQSRRDRRRAAQAGTARQGARAASAAGASSAARLRPGPEAEPGLGSLEDAAVGGAGEEVETTTLSSLLLVREAGLALEAAAAGSRARRGLDPSLLAAFAASAQVACEDGESPPWPEAFAWYPLVDDRARVGGLAELACGRGELPPGAPDSDGQGTPCIDELLAAAVGAVSQLRSRLPSVAMAAEVRRYARELATATRSHPLLSRGASLAAEQDVLAAATARATLNGRDFVTPDDVAESALLCLPHRLELRARADLLFLRVNDADLDDTWLTGAPSQLSGSSGSVAPVKSPLGALRAILGSLRQPDPMPTPPAMASRP